MPLSRTTKQGAFFHILHVPLLRSRVEWQQITFNPRSPGAPYTMRAVATALFARHDRSGFYPRNAASTNSGVVDAERSWPEWLASS